MARTTRLSSGSVSKRSYIEQDSGSDDGAGLRHAAQSKGRDVESDDDDDDSEDDFRPAKRTKGKAAHGRHGNRKQRQASSDEGSSSDFVDEDEEDDEDDVVSDESDEEPVKRGKKTTPRKAKESSPLYGESEVIPIVRAPTDKLLPNRISAHTLDFMRDMQDPRKNDRDWFAVRKEVYDYVNKNWLEFTTTCVDEMIDKVDDTIAWMPAKQLVERIYRDVRFSNDKTPYKRHLSWCISRGGRKGSYAKYYLALSANGRSALHVGLHEAGKEDLQAMRDHILQKTQQGRALRALVNDATFVKNFGAPKPGSGKRTSLWGGEDELKRAPKGYEPDHKDVEWLRLKSYAVSHKFSDKEVLAPDFLDKLIEVARAAQPLVSIINEVLHGAAPLGPAAGGVE